MAQPHVGDELEGVAQVFDALGAEGAGVDRCRDPGLGVDRPGTDRQGQHPGDLDDRPDTAALDVEGGSVGPLLLQDETAEEAQRRLVLDGSLRQVGEEELGGRRLLEEVLAQLVEQPRVAIDRAHVEEDARSENRVGHRLGQPGGELLLPTVERDPPPRIGRHDIARAPRVAAFDEGVAHEARQRLEVCRVLGLDVVVEDEGVVLVGSQCLFLAGPGPEGDPAVWHRRWAEVLLGQAEQPTFHGIPDGGHDPADVLGGGVLVDEEFDDRGKAFAHLGDRADVVRLGDVADEVDGVGLLQPHEISRRDDALGSALRVEDRQVVDVAAGHLHEHLEGQRVTRPDERIRRHDARHRQVGVDPGGDDPVAQIPVGDDPDELALVEDQQAGDPVLAHRSGGLLDGGGRCHPHGRSADDVGRAGLEDRAA